MSTLLSQPALATQLAVAAGGGPDAERLAQLIVYILLVIALVLTVLTVWYWNRTRPRSQAPLQVRPTQPRAVVPNQVVVPAQAPGPQWGQPQPVAGGGVHSGPQWQAGAPAAGPQWSDPVPDPSAPPARGPDWGESPPQR